MILRTIGSATCLAAVLAFTVSTTQAQNLLVNGDFENSGLNSNPNSAVNPGTPSLVGSFTPNPISLTSGPGGQPGVNQGWATFPGGGSAGQNNMSASIYPPMSGSEALLETLNPGNNWNPAGAFQIVTGITPGQKYQFGIWALTDTVNTAPNGILVQLGFETPALGGANSVENPGGTVGINGNLPAIGSWTLFSVMATAPAGCTDAIVYAMFQDNNSAVATEHMYFDNASLTAVPEPSSLALLGLGLASALIWRRRQ